MQGAVTVVVLLVVVAVVVDPTFFFLQLVTKTIFGSLFLYVYLFLSAIYPLKPSKPYVML